MVSRRPTACTTSRSTPGFEAFDDVLRLLPALRGEGRRLGIVTAKRLRTVGLALDRFPQLKEAMDVVIGAEDTERHKPEPDPVLEALKRLDADPAYAAYVGDSPYDIQAGNAAGVFSVAVGWGGIHPDERLLHAGPDALVHTAEELPRRPLRRSTSPRGRRSCAGSSRTTTTATTSSTIRSFQTAPSTRCSTS